jgi:hypothetical protein
MEIESDEEGSEKERCPVCTARHAVHILLKCLELRK